MDERGLALHGEGLEGAVVLDDAVFGADDLATDWHEKGGVTARTGFGAGVGGGFEDDADGVTGLHEGLVGGGAGLDEGGGFFVEDQVIDLHVEVVRPTCGTTEEEKSHQGNPSTPEEAWELGGKVLGVH
jgi:hypothetical protein